MDSDVFSKAYIIVLFKKSKINKIHVLLIFIPRFTLINTIDTHFILEEKRNITKRYSNS